MTDFSKILTQAKELEVKIKESQEKIKNITAEGVSGANSVKVILNGIQLGQMANMIQETGLIIMVMVFLMQEILEWMNI